MIGWLLASAALVTLLVLLRKYQPAEGPLPYFSREFLLTRGEAVFYQTLRRALPHHLIICPKVRLSDLVNCSGEAWKTGHGSKITQKHVDFVLADVDTTAIALVIELDDRSHQRADRQLRDQFLEKVFVAARIPLLRVPAAAAYDLRLLRAQIAECARDTSVLGAPAA